MVMSQVNALISKGALALPDDYHVGNALQSAWLKLQTIENKDKQKLIVNGQINQNVASLSSVANALHDYVVQGLSVAKNQAYFVIYGTELVMQRSYHGEELLARRVMPGIVLSCDTIRKGEKFVPKKIHTSRGLITTVAEHEIGWPRSSEIEGAYCGIYTEDGECLGYTIFDMARIRKSWNMSKTYKYAKEGQSTTHSEFPEEMALRTVIRHRCKGIINSSNDAELLKAINRQDVEQFDAELEQQSAENANRELLVLDVSPESDVIEAQVEEPAVDEERIGKAPAEVIAGEGDDF